MEWHEGTCDARNVDNELLGFFIQDTQRPKASDPVEIPGSLSSSSSSSRRNPLNFDPEGLPRLASPQSFPDSMSPLDPLNTMLEVSLPPAASMASSAPDPRRISRKAELARESRKRKKQYVRELEERVVMLEAKLKELQSNQERAVLLGGKHTSVSCEQSKRYKELVSALETELSRQTKTPDMIKSVVEQLCCEEVDQCLNSNYFLERCEDSLGRLLEILLRLISLAPTLHEKFTLWGLDQRDEFYEDLGLWKSLLKDELGLTEEQTGELQRFRPAAKRLRESLAVGEGMLRDLRYKSQAHIDAMKKESDRILAILSPEQMAKFFVWVEKNDWCMEMLNTVWNS